MTADATTRLKVLMSAYACEPFRGSEPEVGWQWAIHMAQKHDVTVVTRANNRQAIEAGLAQVPEPHPQFIYYDLSPFWMKLKKKGLPVPFFYFAWQIGVRLALRKRLREFDLIHHITFNSFRQPGLWWATGRPVVLGPLGGGQIAPWKLLLPFFPKTKLRELFRTLSVLATPLYPSVLLSFSSASAILVANEDTERRIPGFWRHKITRFLETGVLPTEIRTSPRWENRDEVRVVWVSRFDEIKAPTLALRAFALAHRSIPQLRLTMIGDGPDHSAAKEAVKALGVEAVVTLTGRMPKEQIPAITEQHDFFLFTSLRDTSGNVLIEAMAVGLPSICLLHHGAAEITSDETSIRVRPDDEEGTIQGLATAMVDLANSPDRRCAMGVNARKRVEELFLWPSKAEKLDLIYRKAVH